jgi:hypothetical protein
MPEHEDMVAMNSKMDAMLLRLGAMEQTFVGLSSLAVTIDRLLQFQETAKESAISHSRRLDDLAQWRLTHSQEERIERDEMVRALGANTSAVEKLARTTQSEVDGWVNRGRGVFWVGTIFAGFVQAVVMAVVLNVHTRLGEIEERMATAETVIEVAAHDFESFQASINTALEEGKRHVANSSTNTRNTRR